MCLTQAMLFFLAMFHSQVNTPTVELRLDLSKTDVVCGENQVVSVHIQNKSDQEVLLAGFNVGYTIPRIEVRLDGDEWRRLIRGNVSVSDRRKSSIRLPGGGILTSEVLLWDLGIVELRKPGIYELRPIVNISAVDARTGAHQAIEWSTPVTKIVVKSPRELDKRAFGQLIAHINRDGVLQFSSVDEHIQFCRTLLRTFPKSAYASQLRMSLSNDLGGSLDNYRVPKADRKQVGEEVLGMLDDLASKGGYWERWALPRIVQHSVEVEEVRDVHKAHSAATRWVAVEPKNPKALKAIVEIERIVSKSRPASQPSAPAPKKKTALEKPKPSAIIVIPSGK